MGLSGDDKALMYSLSGVERCGATRCGYTSPDLFVAIDGVQYATAIADLDQNVKLDTLGITEVLNEVSNTAQMTMQGVQPNEGAEVVITMGSINNYTRLFAGNIINRNLSLSLDDPDGFLAPINVIDYTWGLTFGLFSGVFIAAAPSDILAAIVATVPGYTAQAASGLPTIDVISFTDVTPLQALQQLAKRIGGYCDVDYHRVVKLFITDATVTNPRPLTSSHSSWSTFTMRKDLSPVRTRAIVEGGGVTALTEVAPGETILPLSTVAWYNAAGGTVKSGSQHITYTGLTVGGGGTLVGPGASPSAAPALALADGTGLGSGTYRYEYTDVTASGESLPSPLGVITTGVTSPPSSALTPTTPTAGTGVDDGAHDYEVTFVTAVGETTPSPISSAVSPSIVAPPGGFSESAPFPTGSGVFGNGTYFWACTFVSAIGETTLGSAIGDAHIQTAAHATISSIPLGPAGTTARKIYRTVSDGSTFKLLAILSDNTTTTYTDTTPDGSLGATAPSTNTNVAAHLPLTLIPIGNANCISRKIYRRFNGSGTFKLVTTIADNTTTTYTDSTPNASLGADAPSSNTATALQVSLSGIAIGPSGTTARKVYRTIVGISHIDPSLLTFKLLTTIADNTTTTYTDSTADGSLGATAPVSDTSGLTQPEGQVLAGATSILISGTGAFSSTGGWAIIGTGNQVIRYAGISGDTLTGIPASGIGSITATVAFNTTISAAPALVGIPASGAGSVLYSILQDDQVNLLVQVDDLSAQATLAALLGGVATGVVTESIQDGTIGETEAIARGEALLALRRYAQVTIAFRTQDVNTHAGCTITLDFGAPINVTQDFLIQKVDIGDVLPGDLPYFNGEASTDRFSLEDLLRVKRMAA